ncbi:hypothetical protein GCM10023113_28000 [Cellulomonas oligotrophica]|uniref:Uncharacterized protein n=1 Tax=Cellulomonas oligotrophica TaxID=931536 RepID=A0ABQ4DB71_9CELL|nr:hypothetical protein Col01nite_21370 [Cellulomonas oligotrophica]
MGAGPGRTLRLYRYSGTDFWTGQDISATVDGPTGRGRREDDVPHPPGSTSARAPDRPEPQPAARHGEGPGSG